MRKFDDPAPRDYDDYIASALRTEGGHSRFAAMALSYYADRLSGCDCEPIKAYCIAAGVPVIDSRRVAFEEVVRLGRPRADGRRKSEATALPYVHGFVESESVAGSAVTG